MKCRFCDNNLSYIFSDLGNSPLSNSYLKKEDLHKPELIFPLKAYVCENCYLVQLDEFQTPEKIFGEHYAYFSSYSKTWLLHIKKYTETICNRFHISKNNLIVEIASNDGCLLQNFQSKKLNVLGIEPAPNVAKIAQQNGVPTLIDFFSLELAHKLSDENKKAKLIIANNVLAHVPNLNNFVAGIRILLEDEGIATFEFPHILQLIINNQFDTIYHEHFSYFSLLTLEKVFQAHNLKIFDVEELEIHGGSLRIYVGHEGSSHKNTQNVNKIKEKEIKENLNSLIPYISFSRKVLSIKTNLQSFLKQAYINKKTVVAFGAAAKGNTLLNFCEIKSEWIKYAVDNNPHKQGYFLPGTHIPIFPPEMIQKTKPDYLLILPWNISNEITEETSYIKEWNGQWIKAIPKLQIINF